jgi:hypothetical protein
MQLLPTCVGCKLPYELPTSPSYDTGLLSEQILRYATAVFVVPRSNDSKVPEEGLITFTQSFSVTAPLRIRYVWFRHSGMLI